MHVTRKVTNNSRSAKYEELRVIALLGGPSGSGKDQIANFMQERLAQLNIICNRSAFADPLKNIIHLKYGVPLRILNGSTEEKNTSVYYGKTVRQLMRDEGQQACDEISPTIWVDRLIERYSSQTARFYLIPDLRKPAVELHYFRQRLASSTVFSVKIKRDSLNVSSHVTESLIHKEPDATFDYVIENNGGLDDLKSKAYDLVDSMFLWSVTKVRPTVVYYLQTSEGVSYQPFASKSDADERSENIMQFRPDLKVTVISRSLCI